MKLWQSLVCSIITWPLYILVGGLLYILGAIMVPLAVLCEAYEFRESKYYLKFIWAFKWRIMAPFQNWEDGLVPAEYELRYPNSDFKWLAIKWAAFRNPVSGLRWTPILSVVPNGDEIQYVGSLGLQGIYQPFAYELKQPVWFYCWQGPYANIWWQFKVGTELWRIWVGHKLYPADTTTTEYGYRKYGAGFAMQFKRVQKGDNKN